MMARLGGALKQMDQELFQPPNVRGWVGGEHWITSATLFTRYNVATAMVNGQLSESALQDAILVSTRRYAKRQETWFRNQLKTRNEKRETGNVWTLDATEAPEALAKRVIERWRTFPVSRVPFPAS